MRVVVDTNVFVSAALKDRSVPAIAVYLVAQHHILLKSSATEDQLFAVLGRPYLAALISPTALEWLRQVFATAEVVTIGERIVACRDPTDDKFLEVAVSGKADLVLTGDADLLALNPCRSGPLRARISFTA